MKRSFCLFSAMAITLFSLCLPAKESQAAAKIIIKAVSSWPISHVGNDYYKEYAKRVNEKAKGELEIQILGGPEVVSVFDQLKAASTGVVDMIHGAQGYYAGIVPDGTILEMPNPHRTVQAFRESGVWDTYLQAYSERGKITFLGSTWIGMPFYLMSSKAASNLDDLKGLKFRSHGGVFDVIMGQLGISVVKISSAETYEGLQRGIVDGALRNTISLLEFKEYEVMKYITFPAVFSSFGSVFMGENKWKTIPKNLQTMMEETMLQTEKEAFKYYNDMDKVRLKEVQEKHGMKLVHLGEKDLAKINEIKTGPVVRKWIQEKAPKYGIPMFEKILPYMPIK